MRERRCVIVGAAPVGEAMELKGDDCIIAADGGAETLGGMGVRPAFLIGDFDSLGYVPEGGNVTVRPVRKADTDTMLAVKLGYGKGLRTFLLYGCLGGRSDHTIANIQTLAWLERHGAWGVLAGNHERFSLIGPGRTLAFDAHSEGYLSVFAYGGSAGVVLSGLDYPYDGALEDTFPLGTSNAFVGTEARVAVSEGRALVYWTDKARLASW